MLNLSFGREGCAESNRGTIHRHCSLTFEECISACGRFCYRLRADKVVK